MEVAMAVARMTRFTNDAGAAAGFFLVVNGVTSWQMLCSDTVFPGGGGVIAKQILSWRHARICTVQQHICRMESDGVIAYARKLMGYRRFRRPHSRLLAGPPLCVPDAIQFRSPVRPYARSSSHTPLPVRLLAWMLLSMADAI